MKETVIQYLIDNQTNFQEKYEALLVKKDQIHTKDKKVFRKEIEESFKNTLFDSLSNEISRATGADMETIMIVLEEMNLKEYFRG